MKTIKQFIAENRLTMSANAADGNPNMIEESRMDHWTCVINGGLGNTMSLVFSKGIGHNGAQPELTEVLDCLASDAAGIENARDFEEWCSEYGYDNDSRKAERTFKACLKQYHDLMALLGQRACNELIYEIERE